MPTRHGWMPLCSQPQRRLSGSGSRPPRAAHLRGDWLAAAAPPLCALPTPWHTATLPAGSTASAGRKSSQLSRISSSLKKASSRVLNWHTRVDAHAAAANARHQLEDRLAEAIKVRGAAAALAPRLQAAGGAAALWRRQMRALRHSVPPRCPHPTPPRAAGQGVSGAGAPQGLLQPPAAALPHAARGVCRGAHGVCPAGGRPRRRNVPGAAAQRVRRGGGQPAGWRR